MHMDHNGSIHAFKFGVDGVSSLIPALLEPGHVAPNFGPPLRETVKKLLKSQSDNEGIKS